MATIRMFLVLLVCQLTGEVLARGTGMPVPGPVLGLVFLFGGILLVARLRPIGAVAVDDTSLGRTATGLLQNLSLLFVPAGVGVVQHLGTLGEHGPALFLALVGSTIITLVVTVAVFAFVKARWLHAERRP